MINGELGMVHIFSKQLDVQQFHIPYGVPVSYTHLTLPTICSV